MPDMNKVLIMGRMTRDLQVRQTTSGQSVCELSMAINRTYTKNDQQRDEVCFVNVTVWGKAADACAKCLAKGSLVLVEGRLKLDTWEKDGQKRSKLGVVAESVQFLDRIKPAQDAPPARDERSAPTDDAATGGDDIPF